MAVPEHQTRDKFFPPPWMVKAAEDLARAGLPPNAFAQKLQWAKDNPEEAKKQTSEDLERAGVTFQAVVAKARAAVPRTEATIVAERPKQTPQEQPAVVKHEESRTASFEQEPILLREVVIQPVVPQQTTPTPTKHCEAQVGKRDERRAKKEKIRTEQAKDTAKKSASKSASPNNNRGSPTIAESSKMGAAPNAPKVNKPDHMDVDPAVRQVKALSKKAASKSASPASDRPKPTVAESSKIGAARNRPSVPEPDPMDVDQSASLFILESDGYPVKNMLPKWYTDIKKGNYHLKYSIKSLHRASDLLSP